MHFSPIEGREIRCEFQALANLERAEPAAWLETPRSPQGGHGAPRRDRIDGTSVKALPNDLTDADYRHMKKVIGDWRRHLGPQTVG